MSPTALSSVRFVSGQPSGLPREDPNQSASRRWGFTSSHAHFTCDILEAVMSVLSGKEKKQVYESLKKLGLFAAEKTDEQEIAKRPTSAELRARLHRRKP